MKTIGQRINEVMSEVKTVLKDARISVGGNSYEVVTHDMVTSLLHDPMARAGITITIRVKEFELTPREYMDAYGKAKREYMAKSMLDVFFTNSDDSQDFMLVQVPSYAFDQGDKAVGKMLSMGQKYALLKTFMLESVDEEEARPESVYQKKEITPKQAQTRVGFNQPPAIERLKQRLAQATIGKTNEEKTQFMKDMLGINSFIETAKMTEKQIESLILKME